MICMIYWYHTDTQHGPYEASKHVASLLTNPNSNWIWISTYCSHVAKILCSMCNFLCLSPEAQVLNIQCSHSFTERKKTYSFSFFNYSNVLGICSVITKSSQWGYVSPLRCKCDDMLNIWLTDFGSEDLVGRLQAETLKVEDAPLWTLLWHK